MINLGSDDVVFDEHVGLVIEAKPHLFPFYNDNNIAPKVEQLSSANF